MTTQTTTSFDVAPFKRAYESWDIEALLALYADGRIVRELDVLSGDPRER